MRTVALLVVAVFAGCVSVPRYESLRHERDDLRAERDQLLTYIAGAHDDNGMLQRSMIECEIAIRALQNGMIVQAEETAKMRQGCDL